MTRTPKSIAAATQEKVADAANAIVVRGNAVDAVCAGVAMAAALDASVLFGPLHVLVAGPGFGLRCIDGRLRQPGRNAPRPRGFLSSDEVPRAARVAVPALPAALATALSMFGTRTPKDAFGAALDALARKHPRRALLAELAQGGPSVLARAERADAIVAVAGRMAGGTLTVDDLREVRAPAIACDTSRGVALAPFHVRGREGAAIPPGNLRAASCHAVCAADHRGGVAVACYEIADDALAIDALGVLAPLRADPVMRGTRRTDPGAPLACATSVLLAHTEDDPWNAAAGLQVPARAEHSTRLDALIDALETNAFEAALAALAPSCGVLRTTRAPLAYSFP